MGRLGLILGSALLGGGDRGCGGDGVVLQRHGAADYILPSDRPRRRTCGRWPSRAATGCWRSARSAR